WLNAVAARALRPTARVVATFHEQSVPQGKKRAAAQVAARFSGALVACGEAVRSCIAGWAPAAARVVTIGNGVPLPAPASEGDRREARRRLGIAEGAVAVGYLGALKQVKGADLLVEAFARAFADRPEVQLALVGGGPLEPELRRRAAALPNVRFAGEGP